MRENPLVLELNIVGQHLDWWVEELASGLVVRVMDHNISYEPEAGMACSLIDD